MIVGARKLRHVRFSPPMSEASKVVTPAPMEGHGAYNRSSRVQAAGSSPALPLFEHAARNVELEAPPAPIVIADYGASEGRNSLAPLAAAIGALQGACRARARDLRSPHRFAGERLHGPLPTPRDRFGQLPPPRLRRLRVGSRPVLLRADPPFRKRNAGMERLGGAMVESRTCAHSRPGAGRHSAGTPMLERHTRGRRTRTGGHSSRIALAKCARALGWSSLRWRATIRATLDTDR